MWGAAFGHPRLRDVFLFWNFGASGLPRVHAVYLSSGATEKNRWGQSFHMKLRCSVIVLLVVLLDVVVHAGRMPVLCVCCSGVGWHIGGFGYVLAQLKPPFEAPWHRNSTVFSQVWAVDGVSLYQQHHDMETVRTEGQQERSQPKKTS